MRGGGPRRGGLVAAACVIAAALVTVGLAHVWIRLQVIHLGYELSRAEADERRLAEDNRRLRIEIALLRSPQRIERIAREELGMRVPGPTELRTLLARPVAAAGEPGGGAR